MNYHLHKAFILIVIIKAKAIQAWFYLKNSSNVTRNAMLTSQLSVIMYGIKAKFSYSLKNQIKYFTSFNKHINAKIQ